MSYRSRIEDALHSRSAGAVADGATVVLTALDQIAHPADQLLGLACAFKNFAEVVGFSAAELLHQVEKREADCRFRQVNTLSAVRRYAEGEVRAKFL